MVETPPGTSDKAEQDIEAEILGKISDKQLAEDLTEIGYYRDKDRVECEIVPPLREKREESYDLQTGEKIQKRTGILEVRFDPPKGDEFIIEFEKWTPDGSDDGQFAQLVQLCGYAPVNADQIIGSRVPFTRTADGWEINTEEFEGDDSAAAEDSDDGLTPSRGESETDRFSWEVSENTLAKILIWLMAFTAILWALGQTLPPL